MTAGLDDPYDAVPVHTLPVRAWTQTLDLALTYGSGQQIYAEGDRAHSVYAVVSGAVRTVRHSADGRRQIGGFYYPGELFGLEAEEERLFAAEAIRPTRIRSIRRETATQRVIIETALQELSRANQHLAMLGRRSAEEKIASFLLDLARAGPAHQAALPMSRQDMADYLGLALETVSRVLGRFQEEEIVVFASCREFSILKRFRLLRLASA
ncbi:helix-turn-helix domain-containing protein [Brevundimonas diminuta]|uniref:helix-turn-helix domain-containing protein n=1 Tax=Brevundimonas diminuta TaxID=293 RepID=UPI00209711D8|nr:helix-turn-helix domain-containing protein [Brevundimonas diminuta]MCO8030280.1 helix-turn-helix domain-containing protein [Brevundimonas diminuta]